MQNLTIMVKEFLKSGSEMFVECDPIVFPTKI
jgi:hypothetical protein